MQPSTSLDGFFIAPAVLHDMDFFDLCVLSTVLMAVLYYTKGKSLQGKSADNSSTLSEAGDSDSPSRSIAAMLEESKKNCVVFYGSETGTAENYAKRLAKEGKSRFGLDTIVIDLEDYDYDDLESIPSSKILIFVLATAGEGEPTNNAADFYNFMTSEDNNFSNGLQNISYVAFGLGNSTYEHYNSMVRNVSRALDDFGAERIGAAGEGDDGAGSTEEDFLAWKDPMWAVLAQKMGLTEQETSYEPTFSITPRKDLTEDSTEVFLGEPNLAHLKGTASKQSFSASNPYIASISRSNELFKGGDRNCLHIELDLGDSALSYSTGDHVAIWPTNPENEVDSLLEILGLSMVKNTVIDIKALEKTSKVPIPTPTTYQTVLRSYLEICAPVSRQFMASIATFSPDASTKAEVTKIGTDKDYFQEQITRTKLTVAQVLRSIGGGVHWTGLPFSAVVEGLSKLQPRYYSISSSSLVHPRSISISAVVESYDVIGRPGPLKGVATNYLLALKQKQNGDCNSQATPTYNIGGPRGQYGQIQVPIHDFIYESEWQEYKKVLGNSFDMIVAFSRQGPKKVYVQNLLKDHAKAVNGLLESNGHVYVCGDAKYMARDVQSSFVEIIRDERGIHESQSRDILKEMRASSRYQEDIW
ncbi:hypothetical protein G7Z17_g5159 [Cylindrodendrum hubeiense]|uniref:NADPH--hemoprotein reductase n=1 Tax=Cylindrodendrum hubeiense TaxID=595255 RepID=A0A9P5HCE9_9HYPO|nr:hypothetical protein G7Z17_g5159 [Cylindrodendrum hubeiense]